MRMTLSPKGLLALLPMIIICSYLTIGYASSYIGWYGYKKWQHRKRSASILESKERNVFLTQLRYSVEGDIKMNNLEVYMEKGFYYGKHTSKVTDTSHRENFPYQITFRNPDDKRLFIFIPEEEFSRYDSCASHSIFLKIQEFTDTLELHVLDSAGTSATIKAWK
ncbi:hypothetical protein [Pollutibacter soli]|uniref:hypothetical protein n=1 Tax=Pollutibacter soli TaxID=3034157 RepID=UPI0030132C10